MAENNNQNLPGETTQTPSQQGHNQPKKWFGGIEPAQSSQKEIYDILAQGSIIVMEDDLREALRLEEAKASLIPAFQRKEKAAAGLASPLAESAKEKSQPAPQQKESEKTASQSQPIPPVFKPKPIGQAKGLLQPDVAAGKPIQSPEKPQVSQPSQAQEPVLQPEPEKQKPIARPEPVPVISPKIAQTQPGPELKPKAHSPELKQTFSLDGYFAKENRADLKKEISNQKLEILSKLKKLPGKRQPQEAEIARLDRLFAKEEALLQTAIQKDRAVAERLKALEKQEVAADSPEKKHLLEEKRWQEEKKRRLSEEDRWLQEEEAEKLQIALGQAENKLQEFQKEQAGLEKKKKELDDILTFLSLQEKKDGLIESMKRPYQGKAGITEQRELSLEQVAALKEKIEKALQEEQKIELEANQLVAKEEQAQTPNERRKYGQERWQAEEKRKIQEKKRWALEKSLPGIKAGLTELEKLYQTNQKEIQQVENQMEKLGPSLVLSYLKKPVSPTRPMESTRQPEPEKAPHFVITEQDKQEEESIRLQAKAEQEAAIAAAVKRRMEQQKQELTFEANSQAKEIEKEKKLREISRRAEIEQQNKRKDLKGPLIKEEILKQLTKVSAKEEAERQAFLERVAGKKQIPVFQQKKGPEQAVVLQPLSKRSSRLKKIVVRLLVAVFVSALAIGVAAYFYAFLQNRPQESVAPENIISETPISETQPENQSQVEPETLIITPTSSPTSSGPTEPTPPPVLFQVSGSELLSFSEKTEIPLLLQTSLARNQEKGEFRRILFFDSQNQAFVSLEKVFLALGVAFPANFHQNTEEPMLFLYGASQGSQLGVVAKTLPDNSLIADFKIWEKTAVKDTRALFAPLGFAASPLVSFFRSALNETPPFRYQTFSKQDLGICYLITDDFAVFTTSWETMKKTSEALGINQ